MYATHRRTVLFSRSLSEVKLISLAAAALIVFAPQAGAIDRLVPAQYSTISAAIAAANPGDKVKVAPGIYNEQVVIDKAITVEGAGKTKSFIDGSTTPVLADTGQVRITADGNVKFSKFTVRNAGADGGGVRMSILATGPGTCTGAMTYTISDNAILGSGLPDPGDYGFYANGACDTLSFTKNSITQTGSNAIVLERHYGASDVSDNTFDRGVSVGSVDPYFNMNYGGTNITTLQKVSHNKIDMGTGTLFTNGQRGFAISFAGAAFNLGDGRFTQVQIDHNEIVNLKPYRRGIGVWNDASPADGGDITAVINDNKITGAAGDVTGTIGVRLLGLINDTVIRRNEMKKLDTAIQFRNWDGGNATEALISSNNVTQVVLGLELQAGASVTAAVNNKIYATGPWTVTMAIGTVGNSIVVNHLRSANGTGNATVEDLGTGNNVSGNTN